jgi:hypothetical protein
VVEVAVPICSKVKIPDHAHSNPTIEVENDDEVFMSIRAL